MAKTHQTQPNYVTRYGRTVRRPANRYAPEDQATLLPDDYKEEEHDVEYIRAMLAAMHKNRWGEDPMTEAERRDISSGSDEESEDDEANVTDAVHGLAGLRQVPQPPQASSSVENTEGRAGAGNDSSDSASSSDEEYVPSASASTSSSCSSGSDVGDNNASDDDSMLGGLVSDENSDGDLAW